MDMKERLQELAEAAGKRISESEGLEKLNEVRVAYLGKKGELTAILKSMKDVAPEERPKSALMSCPIGFIVVKSIGVPATGAISPVGMECESSSGV